MNTNDMRKEYRARVEAQFREWVDTYGLPAHIKSMAQLRRNIDTFVEYTFDDFYDRSAWEKMRRTVHGSAWRFPVGPNLRGKNEHSVVQPKMNEC